MRLAVIQDSLVPFPTVLIELAEEMYTTIGRLDHISLDDNREPGAGVIVGNQGVELVAGSGVITHSVQAALEFIC